MNRIQRRSAARHDRRAGRRIAAVGSTAVLASTGAGAALVFTQGTAGASVHDVNSLSDTGDPGTLRWAIAQANANPGQDDITFSVTGTITLTADLPAITEGTRITGPGPDALTIDGAGEYRVFLFDDVYASEGENSVTGLTVTHANSQNNRNGGNGAALQTYYGDADLLVHDVVFIDNYSANRGGAINIAYKLGTATISDSVITGNTARLNGGGLYLWSGEEDDEPYLDLTIVNSVISGNTTQGTGGAGTGGGIAAGGGINLTVLDSTVADNSAMEHGGGLYFRRGTFVVERSTVVGNTAAGNGGGIAITHGRSGDATLAVVNSTVADNVAGYYGGGLYVDAYASTIDQSTISGNSARQAGGVFVSSDAGSRITMSTITGNVATGPATPAVDGVMIDAIVDADAASVGGDDARNPSRGGGVGAAVTPLPPGTIELVGTIVAANGELDLGGFSGSTVSAQSLSSILGAVDPTTVTVTDLGGTRTGVGAAALALGPLADNGGPTRTHALLPGSVALDSGPAATDLPTFPGHEFDQRGTPYVRVYNGTADVGAYEEQPQPVTPTFTG